MTTLGFAILGGAVGSGTTVYLAGRRLGGDGSWLASTAGAMLATMPGLVLAPLLPLIAPMGAVEGYRMSSSDFF